MRRLRRIVRGRDRSHPIFASWSRASARAGLLAAAALVALVVLPGGARLILAAQAQPALPADPVSP